MATRYLVDDLDPDADTVELTGSEARHAATVSRLRVGEPVSIGDGRGLVVWGAAASVEPDRVRVDVERRARTEPATPRIVLVQALAKGDRDELAVQAATELGVDGIVPWAADRSVSRWQGAKIERGVERWRTIAREATKQSLRPWCPEVSGVASTADLVRRAGSTRMLVLEPTAADALTGLVLTSVAASADDRDLMLVVGPEGGIAPRELEALTAAGARSVSMGDAVLRTSTAGPAAIAVLSAALGRW